MRRVVVHLDQSKALRVTSARQATMNAAVQTASIVERSDETVEAMFAAARVAVDNLLLAHND